MRPRQANFLKLENHYAEADPSAIFVSGTIHIGAVMPHDDKEEAHAAFG